MKKCILCDKRVYVRGLCRKHYSATQYRVKTKKTTWKAEVKAGKALEAVAGKNNPFVAGILTKGKRDGNLEQ